MKLIIERKVKILEGIKLEYIGRSSNLFWFGFGDIIKVKQGKFKSKEVATYHLNLQCMWRLINEKKLLVTNMDVYSPRTGDENNESFEWEKENNNLFDEKMQQLSVVLNKGIYVNSIDVSEIGDLKINFSNGWLLEVYVDVSNDSECWRMLKSGDLKSHLVITGLGIEE